MYQWIRSDQPRVRGAGAGVEGLASSAVRVVGGGGRREHVAGERVHRDLELVVDLRGGGGGHHHLLLEHEGLLLLRHGGHLHVVRRREAVGGVERVVHRRWLLHHRSSGDGGGLPWVVACRLARPSVRVVV
ncbi:hypothetical protein ABZP36_008041 [Zizania latifolia]